MTSVTSITKLPPAGPLTGRELIPVVQDGLTLHLRADQMAEYAGVLLESGNQPPASGVVYTETQTVLSSAVTNLVTGVLPGGFITHAQRLSAVKFWLKDASTSGDVRVDLLISGASVLNQPLRLAPGQRYATTDDTCFLIRRELNEGETVEWAVSQAGTTARGAMGVMIHYALGVEESLDTLARATEPLTAGDFVHVYELNGQRCMRAANALPTFPAHGFVRADVAVNEQAHVRTGLNDLLHGLGVGVQYLSPTAGKCQSTPPSAPGSLVQPLGVAVGPTALSFVYGGLLYLAAS
jgi:hypothetical protein